MITCIHFIIKLNALSDSKCTIDCGYMCSAPVITTAARGDGGLRITIVHDKESAAYWHGRPPSNEALSIYEGNEDHVDPASYNNRNSIAQLGNSSIS